MPNTAPNLNNAGPVGPTADYVDTDDTMKRIEPSKAIVPAPDGGADTNAIFKNGSPFNLNSTDNTQN